MPRKEVKALTSENETALPVDFRITFGAQKLNVMPNSA